MRSLDSISKRPRIPLDVYKQIKKKSEEISTSGNTSVKLIQNLSNPTNLTNPQIISLSYLNESQDSSSKNISRSLNKNNHSDIKKSSSCSEITLPPLKSEKFVDVENNFIEELLQKVENDYNVKKRNKFQLKKINSTTNIDEQKKKQKNFFISEYDFINDKDIVEEDVWEKLKKAKFMSPDKKNTKIRVFRYFSKQDYISRIKQINLVKYNNQIKNERYIKINNLKSAQLNSLNYNIKRLEKSKALLEEHFNGKYIKNIQMIKSNIEKEKKINGDILLNRNKLLYEIEILKKVINKKMNYKNNIINWLYLQIQVKEKKNILPIYYRYIIENKMSFNEVNSLLIKNNNKTITEDEYIRIKNYLGKNVYDDIDLFLKEFKESQIKSLSQLNEELELFEENKKLKIERDKTKQFKSSQDKVEEKMINECLVKLQKLKRRNSELVKESNYVKKRKISEKMEGGIINNQIIAKKLLIRCKSDSNIDKDNFYREKNKKSKLFNIVLYLYYLVSQNKFDYKISLNFNLCDDKIMIQILRYAENIINLLLKQKNLYMKNYKLKLIYKRKKEEVEKNAKIQKIRRQIKVMEIEKIEKLEKVKEKINKKYVKPNRRIDLDYYRIVNNEKKKKLIIKEQLKNEKKDIELEDFLYDIYVP